MRKVSRFRTGRSDITISRSNFSGDSTPGEDRWRLPYAFHVWNILV